MPMSPQEISKRYKRQSLGMPKASPSSSTKYQVIFLDAIFLLLHMLCVVLGASLFQFLVLFCFVCCSIWLDPSIFVLENDTLRFNCIEHSSFHFYCSASVLVCQYCVQFWFLHLYLLSIFVQLLQCFQLLFFMHLQFRACWFSLVGYYQLSGLY